MGTVSGKYSHGRRRGKAKGGSERHPQGIHCRKEKRLKRIILIMQGTRSVSLMPASPWQRRLGGRINHAVLAVGYNKDKDGEHYWIVKNSWGTGGGEDGYIRMEMGHNVCGLAKSGMYPLV